MFALESAMDELAHRARHRSDRAAHPQRARDRSRERQPLLDPQPRRVPARGRRAVRLVEARRAPAARRDGRWLTGHRRRRVDLPGAARAVDRRTAARGDGSYTISITRRRHRHGRAHGAHADRGRRARGAARARARRDRRQRVRPGDARRRLDGHVVLGHGGRPGLPRAEGGGDGGERRHGATTPRRTSRSRSTRFGAQFVEVRVDADTGEIRVPRALGVFACGRIINPKTARSQFIGGMTMGIGMALLEETMLDPHLGAYVNHDLAIYHVPVNADIQRDRGDVGRRGGPARQPDGRQGHRRDRHRRHGGRRRERGLQRDRRALRDLPLPAGSGGLASTAVPGSAGRAEAGDDACGLGAANV